MKILRMRKKFIALTLGVFFANYFVDRVTKILAFRFLVNQPPIEMLRGCFVLFYSENQGAFLNMGESWNGVFKQLFLLILPVLVCVAGLFYLMLKENKPVRVILLSTVIGGGMGNLVDRIFNDFSVMDFLNFGIGPLRTGILNVADLSVTFGTVLFLLYEMGIFSRMSKTKTLKSKGSDG
jgi:signal peptidase II